MPTPYVEKLAKKHNMSIGDAETKWSEAKKLAEKEDQGNNYAYITQIFKNLMGEKTASSVILNAVQRILSNP